MTPHLKTPGSSLGVEVALSGDSSLCPHFISTCSVFLPPGEWLRVLRAGRACGVGEQGIVFGIRRLLQQEGGQEKHLRVPETGWGCRGRLATCCPWGGPAPGARVESWLPPTPHSLPGPSPGPPGFPMARSSWDMCPAKCSLTAASTKGLPAI